MDEVPHKQRIMDREGSLSVPVVDDDKMEVDENTPLNPLDNLDEVKCDEGRRGRVFDSLLDKAGYGWFHVILVLVCGWALSSDSVEVSSVSFVIPVLTNSSGSLNPSSVESGALDSVIFLGMMVGGYFWGAFADVIGRRVCLITSLLVNGAFGLASALSPNFTAFMLFRFAGGVGVGGSLPVVFSYFAEFFSKKYRNPFIIVLSAFWTVGRLYASIIAWIVIPQNIEFWLGSLQVTSWRVFLILCTIPSISSAIILIFLPESPGFLFTKKKYDKLMSVMRKISKIQCKKSYRTLSDTNSYLSSLEMENHEVVRKTKKQILSDTLRSTYDLFRPPHLRPNVIMIIIEFTLSFGYYGLVLWFPKYFKNIEEASCKGHNGSCADSSSYKDSQGYLDNLYVSLATIPGLLIGIFLINVLGSRLLLAVSMVVSALSTFLIWGVDKTASNIIILSCVFTGFSTVGWNALNVLVPELFPVHLRSTAFGLQSAAGRIGAIGGTELFGVLIDTNPFLPILIVSVLLILGGLSVFLVPAVDKKIVSFTCVGKYLCSFLNRLFGRQRRTLN